MFDTHEDIIEQISAGEDTFAEFKELRFGTRGVISPNTEDMAGEMIAFANTEGGALFLGVTDQGLIRGVPADQLGIVEQWVINIASNNCDPPIRPIIRKVLLPDTFGKEVEIIITRIPKSLYVHKTSGGRWYIRVGSTKRDLTSQELARLFQLRGRSFVFDEMAVSTAVDDDLDKSLLTNFFGPSSTIPMEDLLKNTSIIIVDEEGILRPTVAGLLIFL